jgi:hypothetical protein
MITVDRRLPISTIRSILERMSDDIIKKQGPGVIEHDWGWSGYLCDVHYPSGEELTITGPWSNPTGPVFAKALAKKLRVAGYKVRVGRRKG